MLNIALVILVNMSREQEEIPIFAIHFNLTDRSLEFEDEDGKAIKLAFPSSGTIYFTRPDNDKEALEEQTPIQEAPGLQSQQEPQLPVERGKTSTFTGKLMTKPKQGRIDGSGHPTAWARFAAHVEGEKKAHIFMATFHRAAANAALNLNKDDQIIVDGYPHKSTNPKRSDTLSVVHVVSVPRKKRSET